MAQTQKARRSLTVADLQDIISRSRRTVENINSDWCDEQVALLSDLTALDTFLHIIVGTSHCGCAADDVILTLEGDEDDAGATCDECGEDCTRHADACSYHPICPYCGRDAANRIGETDNGTPIRFCSLCGREWKHRINDSIDSDALRGGRS